MSISAGGTAAAVSAAAFAADARVRDIVGKALAHRLTEVTLWGADWPLTVGSALTAVEHPLSAAARAFKSQALVAVEIRCERECFTEVFLGDLGTCLPVDPDLQPIAARTRP